jgi:hypothetical protein
MGRDVKTSAVSVHHRLLNRARATSRPFNQLLQSFAIERFVYRLSRTPQADRFILKGALMLSAWSGSDTRPTMDIDLLGKIDNSWDAIVAVVKDACRRRVRPDGMSFDESSVSAVRITEEAKYEGVRVRLRANLGNARVALQIDVGFGDVIVPGPTRVVLPPLLDFPPPEMNGYSMESTIAEKFQTMVKLGVVKSRMKDFHDIWMLSNRFDFEGRVLSEAVSKTFENRRTPITVQPTALDPSFARDRFKKTRWLAFLGKSMLEEPPGAFEEVHAAIRAFLGPVTAALAKGRTFRRAWRAPGPWH